MKRWLIRICLLGLAALFIYLCTLPDPSSLQTHNPTTTALMDLRQQQAKAAHVAYTRRMTWKNLDAISPNLVHAVLLAEDDTFYEHHGFDLDEIQEAVKINWQKKRWAYGGSTISQQLARNLYLSPSKNLIRKLKEALITVRLERTLKKRRILEIYLNVIEWGRGVYGAEAASQTYFGKSAADLTPDEAVALASVLPSPRRWSPISEKAFMARRRTQLLERMRRAGYYVPVDITTIPYDLAVPFTSELESQEISSSTPNSISNPAPSSESDGLQDGSVHEAPQHP